MREFAGSEPDIAIARCVTTTIGLSSIFTVTAPNRAATITSSTASNEGRSAPPGPATPASLRALSAMRASAMIATESAAAPYRCEISTSKDWALVVGVYDPKQSGQ
jgi:hypothetical protein